MERILRTSENSIGRIAHGIEAEWNKVPLKKVVSYCPRPPNGSLYPFKLLYGVKQRLFAVEEIRAEKPNAVNGYEMEVFAMRDPCEARSE